jgi:DNA modification methylase
MNQCPPGVSAEASAPTPSKAGQRREEHTFRGNLNSTRHGWLRLTPAYSVRLVQALLGSRAGAEPPFLDPFCGTGTTLLSCTEQRFDCDTADINPFLLWLARSKVASYSQSQRDEARSALGRMRRAALRARTSVAWAPPIHRIERWWSAPALAALSQSFAVLGALAETASRPALNLLRVAFCRALIESSRAHFGHQSMSFAPGDSADPPALDADPTRERAAVADALEAALERVLGSAERALPATRRRLFLADARCLHEKLPAAHYGSVITSPPYANRMSYIRELRPYMYWLGYLQDRSHAGVLDWSAIGGTWGSATSNLSSWVPGPGAPDLGADTQARLRAIDERSPLLSSYVRKYFHDMFRHFASLAQVLRPGGSAFFVVGNSKFYDVVVPVEQVLARQFEQAGFRDVSVETLRKRSSKKELFEYLISARRR